MSEHPRAATGSFPDDEARTAAHAAHVPPDGGQMWLEADCGPDGELERRITHALRSREIAPPAVALLVDGIETRLDAVLDPDDQLATVTHLARRGRKAVAAGVVISALAVYGAGAAAAANPYSGGARALENVAHAVGIGWSAMPAGYTRAQYDAFWGAGYTAADVATLSALWKTDALETKAHAGQLILDHAPVPLAPHVATGPAPASTEDFSPDQQRAFWGAGYTVADITKLEALWHTDEIETKARAGQMILDGKALPVSPSGVATSSAGK